VANINKDRIYLTDADQIFEAIARRADKILTEFERTQFTRFLAVQRCSLEVGVEQLIVTLTATAKLAPAAKLPAIEKIVGLGGVAGPAVVANLALLRASRNRSPVSQYTQKNVGSPICAQAPIFADTTMKAWLIKSEILRTPLASPGLTRVYGVAYNHMGPALAGLTTDIAYHDKVVAKDSPQSFSVANIYDVNDGNVIVDDTMVTVLSPDDAKERSLVPGYSGDLLKLEKFIGLSNDTEVVVSKMSFATFANPTLVVAVLALLFPTKGTPPYHYVRLLKFGKLHNLEVYLFLSRQPKRPKVSQGRFATDIANCGACIALANHAITMAEKKGLRLVSKNVAGLWAAVLRSLPIPWGHYFTGLPTLVKPIMGGGVAFSRIDTVTLEFDSVDAFEEWDYDQEYLLGRDERFEPDVVPIPPAQPFPGVEPVKPKAKKERRVVPVGALTAPLLDNS